MKKLLLASLVLINFQSCINQKITQSDVFNPVKEFELSNSFHFERNFISNTDSTQIETWYVTEQDASINFIYLSGNGSNIRTAIPFFNELGKQFDLNIFSFNYSGYGLSDGEPSIEGILQDGQIALDYYETILGDQNLPTILFGYSLGGFVALNLSDHDAVDQVVLMSTFSSLKELQEYLIKEALPGVVRPFLKLDIDKSVYTLDNLALISLNTKPILFVHGDEDDFIPSSMSYKLYNLSNSERKEIKIIERYHTKQKGSSGIKELFVE